MSSMNNYEMVLILAEADAATITKNREEIQATLTKRKASVNNMNEIGGQRLFHEKNHQKTGNFNVWNISAPPESIQQINADLNVNTSVLKSMIVKAG